MKQTKTKNKKYPLKIKLQTGEKMTIPKQSEFDNDFLRYHGCSLMAEYIALQFFKIHKWPINLYKWHKKNTPKSIKGKVTVYGIYHGISHFIKGKGTAIYHSHPTAEKIQKAMDAGSLVILEQKNPIHTVILIPDGEEMYVASYGKVKKTNAKTQANKATKNETYRGMIVIHKNPAKKKARKAKK